MVKREVTELLEFKKMQFFDRFSDFDQTGYPVYVEFWQKERIMERLGEITKTYGEDRLSVEELRERNDTGRGITLMYSGCAFVLIVNVPFPTEKYFTYALYTELARVYILRKALFNRHEIGIDEFEINSMMGYAFWNTFAPRMISYRLCCEEYEDAKRVCQRKSFLNENIGFIDIDIKKKYLGCVLLADLYAISFAQDKLKERKSETEKYVFPVDKRWYVGKKLHKEMTELLKILTLQLNREDPFAINMETLEMIGSEVYDIFWKLKEYEATLSVL